jgi:hypothetical protein
MKGTKVNAQQDQPLFQIKKDKIKAEEIKRLKKLIKETDAEILKIQTRCEYLNVLRGVGVGVKNLLKKKEQYLTELNDLESP